MSENGNLKRIGGLWLHESKAGHKYFSGTLDADGYAALFPDARLLIFKSKEKRTDRSPDYNLFVEAQHDQEQQPQPTPAPEPVAGWNPSDEDLPF